MDEGTAVLQVRLLGQADVVSAGRSVKFAKRATTLAMIAYLVLRSGQSVARDSLAYTLFPDDDEESSLAALRRTLYLANKALPPRSHEPWLIADNETVRWNDAAAVAVDALEFERLARDGASQARALELYGGDLLEDCYEEWIVVERERLRALYLQTLSALVMRHRSAREYSLALGYAYRLLAVDGWREDVVRQAIAIRYAWGDVPGALVEYDRFAKRLREEMGIEPMPETVALRRLILRNEPLEGERPARQPEPAPGQRTPFLPFIGRDDECARLRHAWDRAARGFGNVVILRGEAGIGKTRLVGEFVRIVEGEGGRAYCGGTAYPESPPYQCLVEALRAGSPVLEAHPMPALTAAVLSRIVPELQSEAQMLSEVPALAPEREAARLLDAFARAFVHLARSRPLLVVFEDVHWAAGTTIDAIAAIARRIAKTRVLVVVTYRDEETPASSSLRRLVTSLGNERRVTHIELGRFDRNEVARTIGRVAGLDEHDEALVDRFYAFSEGNPLFLNETIADALESSPAPLASVPSGIRSLISTRMDRLGDGARAVAQIAAVGGHGCSLDIVRDVSGLSLAETLAGFNELLDRRLVREAGARERFDFVFTHHLIGSSIYDAMTPSLRMRRHARTAHVLERHSEGADVSRELARHYDLAEMPQEAARWSITATRGAVAVYANDDAVRYATIALRHLPDSVEALLLREEASARLGNRNAQRADLDRLDKLSLDRQTRCDLMRRRVSLARALGDRESERSAIERLEEAALAAQSTYWQGIAACARARLCVSVAAYEEAKAIARDALTRLEDTGGTSDRIEALSSLIEAYASTGNFAEANRLALQAESVALAAGDRRAQAETHMLAATLLLPQQRFADVIVRATAAGDEFRAIGDRVGEARAFVDVATSALRLSRWDEARAANSAAAEAFEAVGDRPGLARVLMNSSMLHGRCGDLEHARGLVRRARELQIQLGDERARTASLLNESFLALWLGEAESARALAEEALVRARAIGHTAFRAQALANVGAAELDSGRIDAAIAHMDEGLTLQLELGRMSNAVSDIADLALAHARGGDLNAALRLAERVLLIGSPWTEAAIFPPFPRWVVACVFHWTNDPRARDVLAAAAEVSRSFAASIDVPDLRAHFERLPFVREIEEASAHGRWPTSSSRIARCGGTESGRGTTILGK